MVSLYRALKITSKNRNVMNSVRKYAMLFEFVIFSFDASTSFLENVGLNFCYFINRMSNFDNSYFEECKTKNSIY